MTYHHCCSDNWLHPLVFNITADSVLWMFFNTQFKQVNPFSPIRNSEFSTTTIEKLCHTKSWCTPGALLAHFCCTRNAALLVHSWSSPGALLPVCTLTIPKNTQCRAVFNHLSFLCPFASLLYGLTDSVKQKAKNSRAPQCSKIDKNHKVGLHQIFRP